MYELRYLAYYQRAVHVHPGRKRKSWHRCGSRSCPELIGSRRSSKRSAGGRAGRRRIWQSMCERFEKEDPRPGADADDLHADGTPDPYSIQSNDTAYGGEDPVHRWSTRFRSGRARWCWRSGRRSTPRRQPEAQREVTDMTNTLLKKNAETLKACNR